MQKFVLLLPAVALIASCGGNDESGDETVVKSGDSEVSIASGEAAATELPMGLELYPGAEIQSSISGQGGGSSGAMVTFQTADSQDDVIEFYKKQAKSKGLEIKAEGSMGAMKMISAGKGDGDVNANITATKAGGGGANVTIMVGNQG